jgi:DNA helicase HerA-like ATPase
MLPAQKIGRVINVQGCAAQIELVPGPTPTRAEIGAMAKVRTRTAEAIGIISALSVKPAPGGEKVVLELVLVGELRDEGTGLRFHRGVVHFPCIGDEASLAGGADLARVYDQTELATLNVGTLYQDPAITARLMANDLFSKHFAIVGTTGSGKSCALTCILRQALHAHHHAHVLILDMHGEYHRAFGNQAEVIGARDLPLPFWLLNFQELRSVLTSRDDHYDAQTEILHDAILVAKKHFFEITTGRVRSRAVDTANGTVDSPTPFRLSDLLTYIDEQLGRLERPYPTLAYRRLKARIETLTTDPRYAFMFGNANVEDTMVEVLARLFRIPNDGRPITVIELSSVPEEILDVVVPLIARLTFDLGVWSDGGLPVLLVCEEAHRYIPADDRKGFLPTREALSRIAKEGREYGISLALLTQRPSELDSTILSQCSTILAMRLSTETDQRVMRANVHDSTFGILDYLPPLSDREAIVLGRGAPMPMRIKFQELPMATLPGKSQDDFTKR